MASHRQRGGLESRVHESFYTPALTSLVSAADAKLIAQFGFKPFQPSPFAVKNLA